MTRHEPSSKSPIQVTQKRARADQTVVVVGGAGGLSDRYRDVVEARGLSLRHYEKKVPPGARNGAGNIALVVVMVSMVSHSLREQVLSLPRGDAPVVYLRSPSVSALRAAVAEHAG